jgi:hypothetical protein
VNRPQAPEIFQKPIAQIELSGRPPRDTPGFADAVDIVSMALETRHGVWMAEVPIKPKGICKKKRTIGAPEFRHFTEYAGRSVNLLPVASDWWQRTSNRGKTFGIPHRTRRRRHQRAHSATLARIRKLLSGHRHRNRFVQMSSPFSILLRYTIPRLSIYRGTHTRDCRHSSTARYVENYSVFIQYAEIKNS